MLAEKAQLLIVEDDLDLAEMLISYFKVQGYDVITAAWGEEAVRLGQEQLPELVVLDIRLPDIDGYEVCRRLRNDRHTANIPIIFLTEKRDRVDKLTGLELGVVDYITKPFDIQELRLRVRNALNRSTFTSLFNPVTNLPEAHLVDERLTAMMENEDNWAILVMAVDGLDTFRDQYGFVACDDVLRAVSAIVGNAVREAGYPDDFVGHLSANEFLVVTSHERLAPIRERLVARIRGSIEQIYPLADRQKAIQAIQENRLRLALGQVTAQEDTFESLDNLKAHLQRAWQTQ